MTPITYSFRSSWAVPGALAGLRLEDDLREAVSVAEVDEDQAAEIAPRASTQPFKVTDWPTWSTVNSPQVLRSFVKGMIGREPTRWSVRCSRSISDITLAAGNRQGIEDSDTLEVRAVHRGRDARGGNSEDVVGSAACFGSEG